MPLSSFRGCSLAVYFRFVPCRFPLLVVIFPRRSLLRSVCRFFCVILSQTPRLTVRSWTKPPLCRGVFFFASQSAVASDRAVSAARVGRVSATCGLRAACVVKSLRPAFGAPQRPYFRRELCRYNSSVCRPR